MMTSTRKRLLPIMLFFLLISCNSNRLKINVSSIDLNVKIDRFDQDLFALKKVNLTDGIVSMRNKYGSFFEAYNTNIISIGLSTDPTYSAYLKTFLEEPSIMGSQRTIDSVFHDIHGLESELTDAFKHVKYYFPNLRIPRVVTIHSGFNQSVVSSGEVLGICLDNFLGSTSEYYSRLGLDLYKRDRMNPSNIPVTTLTLWSKTLFPAGSAESNLLANMLYEGKILYFLDAVFPALPDEQKIEYSKEKLTWCHENEAGMWTYLIEHRLLYTADRMNIVRFTGPAPFTTPFGNKSPGRAGAWIGWQIVRKYMDKHPEVTLDKLMVETDYQMVLNESRYNPTY